MCESTNSGHGWAYVGTMTFRGRIHEQCLRLYNVMKQLMWDLYHGEDGKMIEPRNGYKFEGFAPVLEGLGVPRAPGGWDHKHPGFKIWMHGINNMDKIFNEKRAALKLLGNGTR